MTSDRERERKERWRRRIEDDARAGSRSGSEAFLAMMPFTGAENLFIQLERRLDGPAPSRPRRFASTTLAFLIAALWGGLVIGLVAGAAAALYYWISTGDPLTPP